MLRRLYYKTMEFSTHKNALWILAAIAFVESSVFPIPPDVLLIPMVLAARNNAWKYAAICTLASVLGGLLGYYIGAALYEGIGRPIIDFYHLHDEFTLFTLKYDEWGIWIVVVSAITFLPFKLATIASGVADLDLLNFVLASTGGRAIRFFIVAALLYQFGQPIRNLVERNLGLMFVIFSVLLVGGVLLIKWIT